MVLSWKERMYKMRAGPHPQSRASTSPWAPPHRWPLPPWGLPACSPHWQGPSLRCRGNTTFPMAVSGMLRANKLGEQRLPKASGHHLAPSRLLALSGWSVLPSQQRSAAVWVFWCDYIPGVLLSTSHQSKTTRTPNCALADYSNFAKRVRGRSLCSDDFAGHLITCYPGLLPWELKCYLESVWLIYLDQCIEYVLKWINQAGKRRLALKMCKAKIYRSFPPHSKNCQWCNSEFQ